MLLREVHEWTGFADLFTHVRITCIREPFHHVPQPSRYHDVEHGFELQIATELSNQRAGVIEDGFLPSNGVSIRTVQKATC
ncbi:hypothetical protein RGCCGE502_31327 (plasmid) [Rhizobium grahamii CCGE 502]|uniref:Uncharacterized protein n=1 Tax=Rhizobium grahamii CCGE 502 TaxID=990285 RepID=S3H7Q7_9HYPH|nr:hypothetical protein RGCCGE502_31327 [Rhizobium grahamii CCGE 502]